MLVLVVAACGGGSGGASRSAPPPGRALAGTTDGMGASVALTSDGGLIIAGTSSAGGLGGTDVLLVKTDAADNVVWTRFHGGAGNERGYSVRQTSDGGFILAGVTDNPTLAGGPGGIFLVKTDTDGHFSWRRTFGGIVPTKLSENVAARQTSDGGYIVVGTGTGLEPLNPEPDAYLVKIDASGTLLWQKTFGSEAANTWVEGYDVQQTADGGYIVAGQREGGASYAVKVDGSGVKQWEQVFGTLAGPIYAVQETSGGGYVYIGRHDAGTSCAALIVKVDAQGQLQWEKTVGALASGVSPVAGQQLAGGDYILAMRGNARNGDAYVVRADAAGNELWAKLYGGDPGDLRGRDSSSAPTGASSSSGGPPRSGTLRPSISSGSTRAAPRSDRASAPTDVQRKPRRWTHSSYAPPPRRTPTASQRCTTSPSSLWAHRPIRWRSSPNGRGHAPRKGAMIHGTAGTCRSCRS